VITPTLNAERFLLQNLTSVHLRQGESCDVEQIIVDGQSSDRTIETVNEFRERYSSNITLLSGRDENMYDAINRGLGVMKGDIWANLNADDEYARGVIPRIVDAFLSHPEADVVYGLPERVDYQGRHLFTHYFRDFDLSSLVGHGSVLNASLPATFLRRKVIQDVGQFDRRYRYASDYDYLIRIGKRCRLLRLPFVVTKFREHPGSSSIMESSSALQKRESLAISQKYRQEVRPRVFNQFVNDSLMLLLQVRPGNYRYLVRHITPALGRGYQNLRMRS
jgi:glycosyltransferase involved in cell wall biosynthesis